MRRLYDDAKAAGYNATYFVQMLDEHGGLETARRLVLRPAPSDGFTKLWEMKRLDLSVEALVLRSEFRPLVGSEMVSAARRRAR
jgi:hypothetical protein